MRNCPTWIMGGVAAIVMSAAAAPVCGQGEFPLKYVDAPDNTYPVLPFGLYWGGKDERPSEVKADPKGLTGPRRYFPLPWGDRHVMVILDLTKPVKLYVDAAGTGDLSAVPPLTATGLSFGPVTLPGPDGKPGATVRFHPLECGPASRRYNNTAIRCAGYAAGEVTLAGQTYRVAVVQAWTGRYDEVYALPAPPGDAPRRHATFAIDLDRDGKFDRARRRPICDVEIGCRSVTVCHLGNIAYWLKRPLKWDPAKEDFIGDPEASRWLSRPMRPPWRLG